MRRHVMRSSPKRFLKSLFVCSVMGFLVINLNLFLRADDEPPSESGVGLPHPADVLAAAAVPQTPAASSVLQRPHFPDNQTFRHIIEQPRSLIVAPAPVIIIESNRTLVASSAPGTMKWDADELLLYQEIGTDPTAIKQYIRAVNRAQPIRNLDKFDLSTSQNTIVIVVQVHNRLEYLESLIDSLRNARYIEDALLIFSHDFFDDQLNLMISQIDFCPVLQIFYPNSIQLHPHEYPGQDPNDCTRDMKREEAKVKNCINAEWPDKYGHYREAKYTQTKHHWFWKLNHVFDFLDVTRNFNGPVLLLEEDHYVAEDFIHVLWKMYRFKEQACKECSIFTIGSYEKHPTYGSFSNRVEITNWISSKHNMGMALNRQVWQKIKKCTQEFCTFDDYNWDWSLQYISMSCVPDKLKVMVMKSPRIFHIGECGVHHKGKNGNCHPTDKVKQISALLGTNKDSLYPDSLAIHGFPKVANRKLKPNGGWGDHRDRQMCLDFINKDTHR